MVNGSKPLTASTLQRYHRSELTNPQRAYYAEGQQLQGFWHGKLAEEIGLKGPVRDEQFDRLTEGKDPHTGEQLIRYRAGKAVKEGREAEHRAGYDFVFAPSKTISVTALVGGDQRIREWHRAAVRESADFGEHYVQARMGGNREPLTTGKWIAAGFEHDTSRPVDGYAAPQLHTHLVIFNLTAKDANSRARSIQPKELYNLQCAMSRVYQNRLAYELRRGGYDLERGKNHAPEIKGYSREYIEWESPRRQHILKELERLGINSRRASDIVAKQDREGKLHLTAEGLRQLHRAHGETYGQPADRIVRGALERSLTREFHEESPVRSVDFAIRKLSERHSVIERDGYKQTGGIVQNALTYSQGRVTLQAIEQEIERRKELTEQDRAKGITQPELSVVTHYRANAPGERYATREMRNVERELIDLVHSRMGQHEPIGRTITKDDFRAAYAERLTPHQMHMVWDTLQSRDQVVGINGAAGAGKSFAMRTFAQIARDQGYTVRGLAPTSTARKELEQNGIASVTLAKHNQELRRAPKPSRSKERRLYLLDESSLAGAKQVHRLIKHLRPQDRVVLVGDVRQHQSIDAGRIFHQLQLAGMQTIKLDRIMRQRENPDLLEAVQHFQRGDVPEALRKLDGMEAIQEITNRAKRFESIAKRFAESPADTLVISPDNLSRREINQAIRRELKAAGGIGQGDFTVSNLIPRNELYGEDARMAANYEVGNWVRVGRADQALGVKAGDYLQVVRRDTAINTVTAITAAGKSLTYDPDRSDLRASLYRVETHEYAVGDQIQLTAPWKKQGLANRERGTIEALDGRGNVDLRMEGKAGSTGRLVRFNLRDFAHLDWAYSMTSFSSQSMTVRNVLVHIDTQDPRVSGLLDKVLAYVAASRASHDLRFYTDDKSGLNRSLDRLEIQPTALSIEETMTYRRTA